MAQDDAETITERALTRVLGYVDPVAHALATKAAARDETTIAAALKNVLGPEAARAVQEAVQARQGPSDEESSSDDEQVEAPAWASTPGFSLMKPSDAGRTTCLTASRKQ